ncbi:MAG: SDR family oxidoreductase [bacterium]|nr:SDR family oxidoreductase [bacterium]
MADLTGKVALVTGAGLGIGQASALAFAAAGARVAVVDIDGEAAAGTVATVEQQGADTLLIEADVTKASDVERMVAVTVEILGSLDFAHNNVGSLGTRAPIHDYPEDIFESVTRVTQTSMFLCMKYELRHMLRQGAGAIVNTSSVAGFIGLPGESAYVAAKHAVLGLTRTAALEYADHGIRVNAVCPGVIRTPMTEFFLDGDPEAERAAVARHPMGRLGEPAEIADAVVWLCSDEASFVTGHPLVVDGGHLL